MPLKHLTETLLVAGLAVVLILTGIVVSSLPMLPGGLIPWAVAFGLTLLYPFSLYGLFRRNRADNLFRLLHFVPALLAGLWFIIQLLVLRSPALLWIYTAFVWGFSLLGVGLALLLLAGFCLHVIRRRVARLTVLGLALALFLLIGIAGETVGDAPVRTQLASVLWGGLRGHGSGTLVAVGGKKSSSSVAIPANLVHSSDPQEEAWRQKLRDAERSSSSLAAGSGRVIAVVTPQPPLVGRPRHLPSAGMGTEGMAVAFAALYCGVLHKRARMRGAAMIAA
jgi:hypothetical protein